MIIICNPGWDNLCRQHGSKMIREDIRFISNKCIFFLNLCGSYKTMLGPAWDFFNYNIAIFTSPEILAHNCIHYFCRGKVSDFTANLIQGA